MFGEFYGRLGETVINKISDRSQSLLQSGEQRRAASVFENLTKFSTCHAIDNINTK